MDTQLMEPERRNVRRGPRLKMGGKSEGEARTTGTVDRADDQVPTPSLPPAIRPPQPGPSPLVWDRKLPVELFMPRRRPSRPHAKGIDAEVARGSHTATEVAQRRCTAWPDFAKVSQALLDDLSEAGYWGLLIDPRYGGVGAPFAAFSRFLLRMATIEPNVAGLASVHGCIGAVDPLRTFGTPDQKERYLPKLASGERLSAFALTEPCAGSDLTALRTEARLDGDEYVINGEKLFITNAVPGRTVGLVCRIEQKPAVLIVDLPDHENEQFKLVQYGLFALKRLHNNGLKFNG